MVFCYGSPLQTNITSNDDYINVSFVVFNSSLCPFLNWDILGIQHCSFMCGATERSDLCMYCGMLATICSVNIYHHRSYRFFSCGDVFLSACFQAAFQIVLSLTEVLSTKSIVMFFFPSYISFICFYMNLYALSHHYHLRRNIIKM